MKLLQLPGGLKPYYQEEGIAIIYGDCREVLPLLPLNSVQMILTDPPYGMQYRAMRRRATPLFPEIIGDDGSFPLFDCLQAALKVLNRGRHVYVFGRHDLSSLPIGGITELVWDKEAMGLGNTELPWSPSHEIIMFGVYECSAAYRSGGAGNGPARMRRKSVLRFQRLLSGQVADHPTEKPILLLRELIESSSCIGESILDFCMGIGSTLVAAKIEGRQAIGIEIEERYCEIAVNRFRQGVLPLVAGTSP